MELSILHVIPYVAPRYGGPSRAILALAAALRAAGARVLVATTDADGRGRWPVEIGRVVERDGVPLIHFRRRWSEAFKCSPGLARWLPARSWGCWLSAANWPEQHRQPNQPKHKGAENPPRLLLSEFRLTLLGTIPSANQLIPPGLADQAGSARQGTC